MPAFIEICVVTGIRGIAADDEADATDEVDNTKPTSGDLLVCYPCREGLLITIYVAQNCKTRLISYYKCSNTNVLRRHWAMVGARLLPLRPCETTA